jgi:WhiB family redox-sensing transcriptional regulator
MATSIRYSQADGVDRNGPGAAADLLDLLARGKPAWHADVACLEHPELTWFPAQGEDQTAAKAICSTCLVVAECRSWSLAQGPELQGLWGGLSAQERKGRRRPAAQAS